MKSDREKEREGEQHKLVYLFWCWDGTQDFVHAKDKFYTIGIVT
jgi:hypothetical protein